MPTSSVGFVEALATWAESAPVREKGKGDMKEKGAGPPTYQGGPGKGGGGFKRGFPGFQGKGAGGNKGGFPGFKGKETGGFKAGFQWKGG
eukprot:7568101-Karenia_brevis.AAC.1